MGRALLGLLPAFPALQLGAAVAAAGSDAQGRDSGELAGVGANGIPVTSGLAKALQGAGVALDFSTASAAPEHLAACVQARVPLLLGTTGLAPDLQPQLAVAARQVPLLVAANTSLGVAILTQLVQRAAAALPADFDIEIVEAHHRAKLDAPSGTALALGAAAAEGRGLGRDARAPAVHGPLNPGPRVAGEIAYAVLRGGDVVGDHDVHFLGAGERLRLGHSATDRAVFARGALIGGLWLARQPAGRYGMVDVLREK
jgi:4-hydroxy-tetrahydrodipicolinate reductase